jgi:hypothetical protein
MPNATNNAENEVYLNRILQRSATDKAFRARLIAQPDSAIEEVIGVPVSSLPKQFRVQFMEKDAGLDALVVLPDFADPEGVLSDAELEAVAGGDWCFTSCTWTITVCENTHNNEIKPCTT